MKIRKELWFGLILMGPSSSPATWDAAVGHEHPITNGHLGLLMLALVVVAIMLASPRRSR